MVTKTQIDHENAQGGRLSPSETQNRGRLSVFPKSATKALLSPARQQLVELFQETNFGTLVSLEIRDGEPVLNPRPQIILMCKFGVENSTRPELKLSDFILKRHHLDLFSLFDQIGSGTIALLNIANGLPMSAERSG